MHAQSEVHSEGEVSEVSKIALKAASSIGPVTSLKSVNFCGKSVGKTEKLAQSKGDEFFAYSNED